MKVGVAPLLSSVFGGSTSITGGVLEWYRLDDAGLHLLKTETPAGQPPVIAVFAD